MSKIRLDINGIEVPFPQEFKAGTTGRSPWTVKGQARVNKNRNRRDRVLETIRRPEGTWEISRRLEAVGGQRYVVVNAGEEVGNVLDQREAHFVISIAAARVRSYQAAQAEIARIAALPKVEPLAVPSHVRGK